jgi:hypothetical protein
MRITKKVEIHFFLRWRQNNGIVKDASCSRFCHVNSSYTHITFTTTRRTFASLDVTIVFLLPFHILKDSLAHKKAIIQKLKVVNVRLINEAL